MLTIKTDYIMGIVKPFTPKINKSDFPFTVSKHFQESSWWQECKLSTREYIVV